MGWRERVIVLFVVLVFPFDQSDAQSLGNQEFEYLTRQEGLSQSTVEAILHDSEGFMWFGTLEGLNKYDGNRMVVYKNDPNDPHSLSYNEIMCIYEDRDNNIWIGTMDGLNLYDRDSDSFTVYEPLNATSADENSINSIFEDSRGNFWIATYDGLNLLDRKNETFTHFYHDDEDPASLSDNIISDVFEDSRGNLWVGTSRGLNLLNRTDRTFKRYLQRSGPQERANSDYIEVIYEDTYGTLWVGTKDGLYYFTPETEKFHSVITKYPNKILASAHIFSITEDSQDFLWIGTENEGLFAVDRNNGTFSHFTHSIDNPRGINNNSIYTLYESRDHILWIGTFNGGLNVLDRNVSDFEHYKRHPEQEYSLSTNAIFTFMEDRRGNMWIGTDGGGLNRFDVNNKRFYAIRHQPGEENGLPSDVVLDMHEDSNNMIWIGTYRGGLARFNAAEGSFKQYTVNDEDPNSLSQNEVFVVYEDRQGILWAGTNGGGLNKLVDEEKGVFIQYANNPDDSTSLLNDYIRSIYEDSNGKFWIGTYGGGLALMDRDKGTFRDYHKHNGRLEGNVILNIYEDQTGTLWVGTKGGGLAYYQQEKDHFVSYTEKDGLPNNVINGILEDDHGNLWLSTNNGISKFDPQAVQFQNYGLEDGLQSREFKPGAAYKDSNGFMYFGGINGFNRFHPDSLKNDFEVPPVALTDFQVFNKPLSIGSDSPLKKHINQAERIELPYTASVLTFNYAALNFKSGEENSYAYMLDGFDNDWNYVGEKNSATYTNLDPGQYTFRVKAANSDGVWGEESGNVDLIITPPFWRTSWFYLLSGVALIGFIFGGYRYRLRNITQLNKRLEQEVTDRTYELQENNKALKQALHDLEETRAELVEKARKAGMADIATGVLHNIGNVLNSINTSTSITGDLLKKSKLEGLFKANKLLKENIDNLEEFLVHDSRGQKLAEYYLKLDTSLKEELRFLKQHNRRLEQKVQLINNVIAAQQTYASVGTNNEEVKLQNLLEDTLTIYSNSLERHGITVVKKIEETSSAFVQKTKLVHVLLNILKNAKDALTASQESDRKILIRLFQDEDQVVLEISDNGCGIKEGHIPKIFTQGFTTKKDGHGFGLHSCANYIGEMGGKIDVESEGENNGATFTLLFPALPKSPTGNGVANEASTTAGDHA